ncbi:polysaccharide deacetylase family protein [Spirilliplanes yamanashiensis]|uniref:NodB homology domain-containing protein n=1 Tax=Spirilliplanes yamanashiensis TaxID=42233 RepID=A0A8J3Y4A7_9ACTN|nr:polysaccharide deacetylase family protein [Spirilliplanes yamanashiensis]MDP9820046.1 peptidoglycan/xylan/chitin deacetylase (PgdA/CDA1 family) [Spirilliplanes yamanashiensis]GIJ01133.1 hypothetical protein Sya03_04850 [Spirilliplanes yamanashiensis]
MGGVPGRRRAAAGGGTRRVTGSATVPGTGRHRRPAADRSAATTYRAGAAPTPAAAGPLTAAAVSAAAVSAAARAHVGTTVRALRDTAVARGLREAAARVVQPVPVQRRPVSPAAPPAGTFNGFVEHKPRDATWHAFQDSAPAAAPARRRAADPRGTHRATGFAATLGSYRQPALLAALLAVAVLLVADPPAALQDRTETSSSSQVADGGKAPAAKEKDRGGDKSRPADPAKPPAAAAPEPAPPSAAPSAKPSAPASTPPAGPSTPPQDRGSRLFGPAGSLKFTGTAAVALTFDDGPDPVQTPALLDLLAKEQVKATFCVVGTQARAHPDLVRRIADEGHTLCNHSWDHSFVLGKQPPPVIIEDLLDTNEAIRAAVPDAKIPYFRAPGGNFTVPLVSVAGTLGMRSIYWDVDPRDWEQKEGQTDDEHRERVIATVEKDVRKGSIILSHDFAQPQTIRAYEALVPVLKERYELIALP